MAEPASEPEVTHVRDSDLLRVLVALAGRIAFPPEQLLQIVGPYGAVYNLCTGELTLSALREPPGSTRAIFERRFFDGRRQARSFESGTMVFPCASTPFPRALVIVSEERVGVAISQATRQNQSTETWMVKKNAERNDVSGDDLVLAELRTANRLLAILATRGMEQREAIALLHGMSFPPRAIASALSITPNAVSIAIHRMKKAETSDTRGKTITEDADVIK